MLVASSAATSLSRPYGRRVVELEEVVACGIRAGVRLLLWTENSVLLHPCDGRVHRMCGCPVLNSGESLPDDQQGSIGTQATPRPQAPFARGAWAVAVRARVQHGRTERARPLAHPTDNYDWVYA